MKKVLNYVFTISLSILLATLMLGIVTLGNAFNFENYGLASYFILGVYYIFGISLGLRIMIEEIENQ